MARFVYIMRTTVNDASCRAGQPAARDDFTALVAEAAQEYASRGFGARYVKTCLRSISRFIGWLRAEGLRGAAVTRADADRFMHAFVSSTRAAALRSPVPRGWHAAERAAARLAASLLQKRFHPHPRPTRLQAEVARYAEHLRQNRGLAAGTIENHAHALGAFLAFAQQRRMGRPERLRPAQVREYISSIPATPTNSSRRMSCAVVRGYLGYLAIRGRSTQRLAATVPIVPAPRVALAPDVPSLRQIGTLLRTLDRRSPCGKRTYAAILCMSDLGMRVGDVSVLELSDIDWRNGTIRVGNKKSEKPFQLPLPDRLGRALVDYLKHGRPKTSCRYVFVGHGHPPGGRASAHSLKSAVWRAWEQSGLHGDFSGTHILRHSAGTRMKRKGVPIKVIADTLGHSALQTAALYAQVELPALRRVAQPWPRGAP